MKTRQGSSTKGLTAAMAALGCALALASQPAMALGDSSWDSQHGGPLQGLDPKSVSSLLQKVRGANAPQSQKSGASVFQSFDRARADLYQKVAPAVVRIITVDVGQTSLDGFEPGASPESKIAAQPVSGGSGFIIRQDGIVVTNYHVVARDVGVAAAKDPLDRTHQFIGEFINGQKIPLVPIATNRVLDLALLKAVVVDKTGRPVDSRSVRFPTVALGDATKTKIGETVFALGAPSMLAGTFTMGTVTSQPRPEPEAWNGWVSLNSMPPQNAIKYLKNFNKYNMGVEAIVLQVSAASDHGSSGGPLFNSRGEVIGVVNSGNVRPTPVSVEDLDNPDHRLAGVVGVATNGVNFAIVANQVKSFVDAVLPKLASSPAGAVIVTGTGMDLQNLTAQQIEEAAGRMDSAR
jgi:S1-C subfamily serine protease